VGEDIGLFFDYFNRIAASAFSGYFAWMFGVYMAPSHKVKAGIIICIIEIAVCVTSMTVGLLFWVPEYLISVLCQIATIVTASYILINAKNIPNENERN
jgi:hypothetical protein